MRSSIEPIGAQRAINGLPARNFKNRRRDSVRSTDACITHLLTGRSMKLVRSAAFADLCVFARNQSPRWKKRDVQVSRKDAKVRKGAKFREDHLKGLCISQRGPRVEVRVLLIREVMARQSEC